MTSQHEHGLAELGQHFVDLGAALATPDGRRLDPDRVMRLALRSVEPAEQCALTLLRPGTQPRTVHATDPVPEQVDSLQYTTGQGPCLDASHGISVVVAADLADDARWPEFGPRCVVETGVRSMLSVRLSLGADDEAAVNFYSGQRAAFDESAVEPASVIAPFAALAVEQGLRARDAENLRAALSSSRQIGTAVGILMASRRVTSSEAFELLRRASQHLNRKLRDVAAEVEQTGALPEARRRDASSRHGEHRADPGDG